MLMNVLRESYRDLLGRTELAQPVVTVPVNRPAANTGGFSQSKMQARRLRRDRRMDGQYRNVGWMVRAW